jgi:hypothetical protein
MLHKVKKSGIAVAAVFSIAMCTTLLSTIAFAEDLDCTGDMTVQLDDSQIYCDIPTCYDASDTSSNFLFYDQLDANNQSVYNTVSVLCDTLTSNEVTITFPETISLSVSTNSINTWTDEEREAYYNTLIMNIQPGLVACTMDYPMLFWVDFNKTAISPTNLRVSRGFGSQSYTIRFSSVTLTVGYEDAYGDIETVQEKKAALEEAIANFPITGETDAEKCESIEESLKEQITYDVDADFSGSIAGSLLEPYGAVCEGYAKAFKVLCDRENIPCIVVIGNYDRENLTAHMWNNVVLDDNWYGVDVTWDDTAQSQKYFLRGSNSFSSTHTPESIYTDISLSFPELCEGDYIFPTIAESTEPEETTTTETTTETTTTTTELTTTTTTTTEETTTEATTTTTTTEATTTTTTTTTEETTTEATTTTETTKKTERTTTTAETTTTETTTKNTTTTEKTTSETVTGTTSTTETTTALPELSNPVGDVNEDGVCSLVDYVLLRKFLIQAADVPCTTGMDCNQDGVVNVIDAIYLSRICFTIPE